MIAAFIAEIETSFAGFTSNAIITIQSPLFLRGKNFDIKPTQLGANAINSTSVPQVENVHILHFVMYSFPLLNSSGMYSCRMLYLSGLLM